MTNGFLLDSASQPKFINSLPSPVRIDATEGGNFTVEMRETEQWLGLYESPGADGLYGTKDDVRLNTTVWGYGLEGQAVTYPGPTFIARENVPIKVLWENKLPIGKENKHLLSLDFHIPIMDSLREVLDEGYIPTVVHLHGGHTESASDGIPEAWYSQDFLFKGHDWKKETYHYANDQPAGTLWYHDHTMSITRLNVYTGLSGFYLLRDDNENKLIDNGILPDELYEKELVIQDRQFTADGELYYSSDSSVPGVPDRMGVFGDSILVNGMAWPKLEVEPRKYRLRLLNGSDSRFYELKFDDSNEKIYQIGTDQGFLENPLGLDELVLAPGERADVIVDFTSDSGDEFILQNTGPGAAPGTTGQIMKFTVNQPLSDDPIATVDTDESDGLTTQLLSESITTPKQTGPTRQLVLFKNRQGAHSAMLLGTMEEGSFNYHEPTTEKPVLNTTEVWEFYNTTDVPHAMHVHLVAFKILNRQNFSGSLVAETDSMSHETKKYLQDVALIGNPKPPAPSENGRKDTVIVNPGEVVRIVATFDRPGEYVWHCHLLAHEDYDMMRPLEVVLAPEPITEESESSELLAEVAESDDELWTESLFQDELKGTSEGDELQAGGGNDKLLGEGGNDKLLGGSGNDDYIGGVGADEFQIDVAEKGIRDRFRDVNFEEGDIIIFKNKNADLIDRFNNGQLDSGEQLETLVEMIQMGEVEGADVSSAPRNGIELLFDVDGGIYKIELWNVAQYLDDGLSFG